jgi:hypothetical protein
MFMLMFVLVAAQAMQVTHAVAHHDAAAKVSAERSHPHGAADASNAATESTDHLYGHAGDESTCASFDALLAAGPCTTPTHFASPLDSAALELSPWVRTIRATPAPRTQRARAPPHENIATLFS